MRSLRKVKRMAGRIEPKTFWFEVWSRLPKQRSEFIKAMLDLNGDYTGVINATEIQKILYFAVKIDYPRLDMLLEAAKIPTKINEKTYLYNTEEVNKFYEYFSMNDWEVLRILEAYENI